MVRATGWHQRQWLQVRLAIADRSGPFGDIHLARSSFHHHGESLSERASVCFVSTRYMAGTSYSPGHSTPFTIHPIQHRVASYKLGHCCYCDL